MRSPPNSSRFPVLLCGLLGAVAAFTRVPLVFAHEGLHEQIDAVSAQIADDKDNAALYLKRSDLYRQHEDWAASLADLEHVRKLDPACPTLDLALGRTLRDAGLVRTAVEALDRFLATNAEHGPAWSERADALSRLGRHLEAADSYARAIAALSDPRPDHYLARAKELAAAGAEHVPDALACLDDGVKRFGPLVTLESYAVDLELRSGRFDDALHRIDVIIAQFQRKERWLARRGDVLAAAGQSDSARVEYERALAAIAELPARYRNTESTRELAANVRQALRGLTADTESSRPGDKSPISADSRKSAKE